MTEEEYHRIARREKIFYAVLIIAWCFAFAVWFTIGFPKAKWVLIGGGTLIYLYLKSTFTGLPWSRRLVKPDPAVKAKEEVQSDEDFPLVSETERKGYIALAGLCLTEEMQKKLAPFFWNAERLFRCGAGLGIWQHASLCDGIHGRESYFFPDGA